MLCWTKRILPSSLFWIHLWAFVTLPLFMRRLLDAVSTDMNLSSQTPLTRLIFIELWNVRLLWRKIVGMWVHENPVHRSHISLCGPASELRTIQTFLPNRSVLKLWNSSFPNFVLFTSYENMIHTRWTYDVDVGRAKSFSRYKSWFDPSCEMKMCTFNEDTWVQNQLRHEPSNGKSEVEVMDISTRSLWALDATLLLSSLGWRTQQVTTRSTQHLELMRVILMEEKESLLAARRLCESVDACLPLRCQGFVPSTKFILRQTLLLPSTNNPLTSRFQQFPHHRNYHRNHQDSRNQVA